MVCQFVIISTFVECVLVWGNLLDELLVSLLLMLSGMFFSNVGGWLLCRWTYDSLLLGFMYGL